MNQPAPKKKPAEDERIEPPDPVDEAIRRRGFPNRRPVRKRRKRQRLIPRGGAQNDSKSSPF
jgi:hypothetical protein